MDSPTEHTLLRIFIGEDDGHEGGPLCRAIIETLRDHGLAGATVLKGIAGFGRPSRLHTGSILRLAEDLPIVIESIDTESSIEAVIPALQDMAPDALITTERIRVRIPGI